MRVLHISGEYRCTRNPQTTVAVKELVENTKGDLDCTVFSLKRTWNPLKVKIEWLSPRKVAHFDYWGLPKGILLAFACKLAAKQIFKELLAQRISVDVVHGHKLTIEGLITDRLAQLINCKYVVSVRGKTDAKILLWKPFLRDRFRNILKNASHVFFVSGWAPHVVEKLLGERSWKRHSLLPNGLSDGWFETNGALNVINYDPSNNRECIRLVTVFNLHLYRLKGFPELLEALSEIKSSRGWLLDVYGGGSNRTRKTLETLVTELGLQGRVCFRGTVDNDHLQEYLRHYDVFVMASRSETFGIVYIEALASGLPIMYSAGRGIDGYFSGDKIGIAVDPAKKDNIVDAVLNLIDNHQEWKARVAQYIKDGGLDRFRRRAIVDNYISELRAIR